MDRHQPLAGQPFKPVQRHLINGRVLEGVVEGPVNEKGVGGELRAPLPLEPEGAEVLAQVVGTGRRRGHAEALAQGGHVLTIGVRAMAPGEHGQVGDPHRRTQDLKGPGVDLVVDLATQGWSVRW